LDIKKYSFRSPRSRNQIVNGIDEEGLDEIKRYRNGYKKPGTSTPIINSCFYLIQPCPDLSENRVKLGFTENIEQRLCQYKTICPTAKVVNTWKCKREWEKSVIAQAVSVGCKQVGEEVFDLSNLGTFVVRINNIFSMYELTNKG